MRGLGGGAPSSVASNSRLSVSDSSDEDERTLPADIYWVPFKGQALLWALGN